MNENTQSIFPPDVHAVMDHGKRDVSRFPIATGEYYKHDYSAGVDISRYKNIPVPTSYMAERSDFDFVGGYDYGRGAGILHVADHHISPGKKQWTWGCGDFGRAWDRSLTDEDGPYVELMTGVYTDNQPDFTWLKPFEEKTFTQYFMPYKAVGAVKNATVDAVVNLETGAESVTVTAYASGKYPHARILLTDGSKVLLDEETVLSPVQTYQKMVPCAVEDEAELTLKVLDGARELASYTPLRREIPKLPEPAQAAKAPEDIMTCEELYLTGLHLEQYRHATFRPDPYYLEGLKRDPGDIRLNNACGSLLLRRGQFERAERYFRKALERCTWRNPNPYDSEPYYNLGLALEKLDRPAEAKTRLNKLLDYGERHIFDQMRVSYFAVSLPDFQIFDDDLDKRNRAHCHYLIGLARLGMGQKKEAAIREEPSHQNAIRYRGMCPQLSREKYGWQR